MATIQNEKMRHLHGAQGWRVHEETEVLHIAHC